METESLFDRLEISGLIAETATFSGHSGAEHVTFDEGSVVISRENATALLDDARGAASYSRERKK